MRGALPEWSAEVEGANALFDWFGYWPDFHDAEILSVTLDRSGSCSVSIHASETTDESGQRRLLRLAKASHRLLSAR